MQTPSIQRPAIRVGKVVMLMRTTAMMLTMVKI
jgi:hypothetical protein